MSSPVLLWLRLDLRLSDNPALQAAAQSGRPVIPVFIWSPEEEAPWPPGAASRWWLHQSLLVLSERYRSVGSRLIIRQGPSLATLQDLVRQTGATALYWNRRYEPAVIARDSRIKSALKASGLAVETFNGALLHEPWTVQNKTGRPFQVFTPFWKHCLTLPDPGEDLPAPDRLTAPRPWPESLPLASLGLEPAINWTAGLKAAWQPGEAGAARNLQQFLERGFAQYTSLRNRPDQVGTSQLSPHLHFGEISPRQIWNEARRRGVSSLAWKGSQYLSEIGWREFAHHLLFHFPHTSEQPLRAEFAAFPWRQESPAWLQAWKKGRTGYPIVDAGLRELWTTGWMHNRVRMIVASFLVKDLLISWQEGARWFWDTLVDADLAQNTLGWQWTAGCGADAAPYFRVFNPTLQGEKFDPEGLYVSRWCPELRHLPPRWIHQPWTAPPAVLAQARVELGQTYPEPMVSHAIAREVALEAYGKISGKRG